MLKNYFFYVLGLTLLVFSCKAPSAITTAAPLNELQTLEDSLLGGHLGMLVVDAETGKVLGEHNSHKYFVPASNTKLLSLYAGLKYLGDSLPGIRYFDAGDTIFAFPTGDPTLLASDYRVHPVMNWLRGIQRPVVMYNLNWKAERYGRGWTWSDYQASYQPERSAFPVNGNMMPVRFSAKGDSSGSEGLKRWMVSPMLVLGNDQWNMKPDALSYVYTPQGRLNTIRRDYASNGYEVLYNGRDTSFRTEIPFVTYGIKTGVGMLRAMLSKSERDLIIADAESPQSRLLRFKYETVYSQPTDSMLRPMMHRSDNFFAEQTMLMASNALLGYMNEREMIDTLMKTEFKGMPDKPAWVDGSGLSRYNMLSPADFVWLLDKMRKEFPMERIQAILPTGNAGTLTNYYTVLNGKIFAKTGTLSGQVALSGYLYAKSGKLLLFSALVNNHNMEAPKVRRHIEKYLLGVWEGN